MSDEGKAATEVAKTAGKVVDAARELGGFIARLVGGPLEQGVGILEDHLKYARAKNLVSLQSKYQAFLKASNRAQLFQPVPLKIAMPLLHAASLEDDAFLQERWAGLLANATDANTSFEIRRVYVDILESLTSIDCKILDRIYGTNEVYSFIEVYTKYLPDRLVLARPDSEADLYPSKEVAISISNLFRQQLVETAAAFGGGRGSVAMVYATDLGRAFFEACRYQDSTKSDRSH